MPPSTNAASKSQHDASQPAVTSASLPTISTSSSVGGIPSSSRLASSTSSSSSISNANDNHAPQTSAPVPTADSKSNNTGLTAAVGVLAGLLVLALLAIGFLLLRRCKRSNNARPALHTYSDASDPQANTVTALQKGFSDKPGGQAGLAEGPSTLLSGLDDKAVNAKFAQLDSAIQDWVVGSFRVGTPVPGDSVSLETAALLGRFSSEWRALLSGDPRGRFVLLRGLVATALSEANDSGDLIGDGEICQLAAEVGRGVPTAQSHFWKAQTLALVSSTAAHRAARTASIERLTALVDGSAASLINVPQATSSALATRARRLRAVVTSASDLALELSQQKIAYEWTTSVDTGLGFDGTGMEDVLQEQRADRLAGKRVRAVVFPDVRKWGSEEGGGWERSVVIRKAAVLV